MSRALPPLNWLRAFEAAARHLSFTGAAAELNMTQSAVSQQIKSLETRLGRPLFHRRPRALELTPTGATYLPVVREAFRTLALGTRAVIGDARNVVNVHANLSFSVFWLAPRLARFRARHPEVTLNIITELWEPQGLAEGADVEIRFSLRLPDGLQAALLHRDASYPVCAPGFAPTLQTLPDLPLYDCANLMCNWAAWAEGAGLDWPDPAVTYASTFSITLPVALSGGGLAMAHDLIARDLIEQGRLIAPFAHRERMQEAYYLIRSPRIAEIPGAQAFADWLSAEMTAFQPPAR